MIELTLIQAWGAVILVILALIGAMTILSLAAFIVYSARQFWESRAGHETVRAIGQIQDVSAVARLELDQLSEKALREVRRWLEEVEAQQHNGRRPL